MIAVIDDFLVAAALVSSAAYVVLALGPKSLRRRLLASASTLLARVPALKRMAQRLEASAAKGQGACGGCDNCGSESPTPPQSGSIEVHVPVTKIGRRS